MKRVRAQRRTSGPNPAIFALIGALSGAVTLLGDELTGLFMGFGLLAALCIVCITPRIDLGRLSLSISLAFLSFVATIAFLILAAPRHRGDPVMLPAIVVWGSLLVAGLLYCALFLIVGTAYGIAQRLWPPPPGYPHCESCGYLLIGLPEPRCPECGKPFTKPPAAAGE